MAAELVSAFFFFFLFLFFPVRSTAGIINDRPWTMDLCGARTPREKLLNRGRERLANMDRKEKMRRENGAERRETQRIAGDDAGGVN